MKRNLVGKILGKIKIFVQDFVPIRTALMGTKNLNENGPNSFGGGDQKYSQAVSYDIFFQDLFGLEGSKKSLEKNRQMHNLKISDRLLRSKSFFQKNIPGFICSVFRSA